MRILLTGSKGMLGSDCRSVLESEYEVVALDRKDLDITLWDKVVEKLNHISPQVVVNCAAFTDVDACEDHPVAVRKANVEGPRNLAQAAARFNCKMIHISTDYVFGGQKSIPQPYFEDDAMDPISVYGRSKMESEMAVRDNAFNYVIVRTGWLYGVHGKNFITSLLSKALNKKRKSLKMVDDQFGSPTWTYRLALQIRELIRADVRGTYHATSEGYCSRFEYAKRVLRKLRIPLPLERISIEGLKTPARRPANCILENRLLKKQGLHIMPDWKEDLDLFLQQHGEELISGAKSRAH
ncbi:MAG: dTDP-4-dehydrorhamnose reductase [Thermodesulfobacteriota bacterium]